jgi:ABC-type multidrug transport system fused ATPase/permease subunit
LLQLVLGLKQPETGAVFLDDVDIRSLDMAAMRRRIGIVGQGATLFPGTLRENVALGLPLSDKAIWEALGLAGMEVDVSNMPLGLSTIIGDTDQLLSGGQVQRLLFARAIAARPRLVVLDEATSALDPAAQATITRSLKQLGVSILAVAHRLETLRECDSICVLDGGEIVQHGSFEELSSAGGPFRSLLCAGQFAKTAQ